MRANSKTLWRGRTWSEWQQETQRQDCAEDNRTRHALPPHLSHGLHTQQQQLSGFHPENDHIPRQSNGEKRETQQHPHSQDESSICLPDACHHQRAAVASERILQESRDLRVAERHMRALALGVSQSTDHIAQRQQTHVDVDTLLHALTNSSCALQTLRTYMVVSKGER